MSDLRRQLGKVMIQDILINHEPQTVAAVLCGLKFVPILVNYNGSEYEMTGLSPEFEQLESGSRIPIYTIEVHVEDKQLKRVSANKIEVDFDPDAVFATFDGPDKRRH